MSAILESPPHALTIAELAQISQQLANEVSRLPLLSEGFSVADYLSLDGNYFVEYLDGCLQGLPMPSGVHQDLAADLMMRLKAWSRPARLDADGPLSGDAV